VQRPEAPLPAAVQETAAAATADRLYVIGGYDGRQQSLSSVYVFDGSTWSEGPALRVALNHPAAAALGPQVYEAGGFGANGASNRVFVLDAGGSQWREVAPMHHARGAGVLVALRGRLLAIGGRSGNTQIAPVESYDPTTGHWTDLPPLPHARNHLSAYVSGSSVCVTGGREPATSTRTDCLDSATSTWQPGPTLPVPTSGAAAGLLGTTVVVAGGEPADESRLVSDVQEWHDGTWSTEPMLTPRHGTGYAFFGGRLWMCGGATAPGVNASNASTSFG
jgi:N-acetylneuraminic acid mutarotase